MASCDAQAQGKGSGGRVPVPQKQTCQGASRALRQAAWKCQKGELPRVFPSTALNAEVWQPPPKDRWRASGVR